MKTIIVLVGPAGSGKSTLAKEFQSKYYFRISQDDQGKQEHFNCFMNEIIHGTDIIVDRMNFDKKQREKYLIPSKNAGYKTKIIVLHENYDTCLERMKKREGHPTIKDETSAKAALHTFFTKYERPEPTEADEIEFVYPWGFKPKCVIVDLDGTMCNIDHRQHYVRGEGKKNWKAFFDNIGGDSVNEWCEEVTSGLDCIGAQIVYCSGRGEEYRKPTTDWLLKNFLYNRCFDGEKHHLYMRPEKTHRADTIIKEVILDFEILTRFTPMLAIDDRPSVCRMWRKRGIVCLQCNDVEF